MSAKTVVIDYGIGNVFSVCNAIKQVGGEAELTARPEAILRADRVILPGVGAFARAMDALKATGIASVLPDFIATGRPFLGVCIGMQILMEKSNEFGMHEGLGFIEGEVQRIPDTAPDGGHLRVPHIGWASLQPVGALDTWRSTPLNMTEPDSQAVYFVHSYHCQPANPAHRIAIASYGGAEITAAIRRDNIYGVQFHPERSGKVGQTILKTFLKL